MAIAPFNSSFFQNTSSFAIQPFTNPSLDLFKNLQLDSGQDRVEICSRVNDCALLPIGQLVETAVNPSFQSLNGVKTDFTLEEFKDGLFKQVDDASLTRYILSHKKIVIPNDLKISMILGDVSRHHLSALTAQFLIKTLSPEISYSLFTIFIKRYGSRGF